jgi:hypothetical protein
MIQKFVTTLGGSITNFWISNPTSRLNKLVSLEIPKFATELVVGTDAKFGIGTLVEL